MAINDYLITGNFDLKIINSLIIRLKEIEKNLGGEWGVDWGVPGVTFLQQAYNNSETLSEDFLVWLSSLITDVSEEYILGYIPVTANQSVIGIVILKEY
jgi:hypothetical protein